MNLSRAILRDLKSGQSTADAVAIRAKIEKEHATALLDIHVANGLATSLPIYALDAVKAYRLTDKGRQQATAP